MSKQNSWINNSASAKVCSFPDFLASVKRKKKEKNKEEEEAVVMKVEEEEITTYPVFYNPKAQEMCLFPFPSSASYM